MHQTAHTPSHRRSARTIGIAVWLCLVALAAAQLWAGTAAASGGSKRVARTGAVQALGRTVLTTRGGRTLYSLSVERHGRFICKGSCLLTWHPLLIARRVKPKGPVRLGTVRRPEGRRQVTFKGRPLYSFSGDTKKGEANGEGFKDVGTWHAASIGPIGETQPQPKPQPPPPYPYPY